LVIRTFQKLYSLHPIIDQHLVFVRQIRRQLVGTQNIAMFGTNLNPKKEVFFFSNTQKPAHHSIKKKEVLDVTTTHSNAMPTRVLTRHPDPRHYTTWCKQSRGKRGERIGYSSQKRPSGFLAPAAIQLSPSSWIRGSIDPKIKIFPIFRRERKAKRCEYEAVGLQSLLL
jgi:hypothetical protein